MTLTESGPAMKGKRPKKLKLYVFDISPYDYGTGVVVVAAYTLPQAQKLAAGAEGRSLEPKSYVNYKIVEADKPKTIAYAYYAE